MHGGVLGVLGLEDERDCGRRWLYQRCCGWGERLVSSQPALLGAEPPGSTFPPLLPSLASYCQRVSRGEESWILGVCPRVLGHWIGWCALSKAGQGYEADGPGRGQFLPAFPLRCWRKDCWQVCLLLEAPLPPADGFSAALSQRPLSLLPAFC